MKALLVVAILLLLILCVVPVVWVVLDSFVNAQGGLTLEHYVNSFAPPHRIKVLGTSLELGVLSTLIALVLGVPYAFFSSRVRVPGRSVFSALYILPLVLPPLLMTMGWTQFLGSMKTESGDTPFIHLLGGVGGAALILGLSYFPFVTLFARKGFTEIGAGLEEAARVNTGPLRAFLRITLPLALPGILAGSLFVFIFAISDFSVVDYLSTIFPVKERVNAYTFETFSAFSTNWERQSGQREAVALSLPIALLSIGLLITILVLLRRGRGVTMTSGHTRPHDIEEGSSRGARIGMRAGGFVVLLLVLTLSLGIPVIQTVIGAIGRNGDLFGNIRKAMSATTDGGFLDLENSLMYSAAAATAMTAISVVLGHHMVRKGPRREALILVLSFLPLAFGPILFGSGLIRTWNQTWLQGADRFNPIYETPVLVILMLTGKYLPFALAAVTSSMKRLDPGYEEAAAVSGAGGLRRLGTIIAPLVSKGIAAGFVLGFVFSLRELDTIVMLQQSGNRTAMMKIYTWVHIAYESNVAAMSLVLIVTIAVPFVLFSLLTSRKMKVV